MIFLNVQFFLLSLLADNISMSKVSVFTKGDLLFQNKLNASLSSMLFKTHIGFIQLKNKTHNNSDYSNISTVNLINSSTISPEPIMHSTISQTITPIMRLKGIIALILFGFVSLIIRVSYSLLKKLNSFYARGMIDLSNQILFLFFCFDILFLGFVYGFLDGISINWEQLLCSIALFIIGWMIFCLILLLFSLTITKKWELSERLAQSFSFLKKLYQEQPKQRAEIIDAFEFLIIKRYFYVPLFPILKPCSLRKELWFNLYLQYCLSDQLRLFFKLSWSSWVIIIIGIMFWYVLIIPVGIKSTAIIIMIIPLMGIFTCLGIYCYTRIAYRRIVIQVNNDTMLEFIDHDYESNDMFQSLVYPLYLKKTIDQEGEMETEAIDAYTCYE